MKLKIAFVLLLYLNMSSYTKAQSFIAFSTGISKDLNNSHNTFYHIPLSVRIEPFKRSGFFIEGNYGVPFLRNTNADAYTANSAMPAHVTLHEVIRPSIFTVNVGGEIHLYTDRKSNSSIYLDLTMGVSSQHFKVSYKNYDNRNYEVLNPDVSTDSSGLTLGIAVVYNFHKPKQDMFVMLHVQTPPLVSNFEYYPMTYKLIAPLQLAFGYKLFNHKK